MDTGQFSSLQNYLNAFELFKSITNWCAQGNAQFNAQKVLFWFHLTREASYGFLSTTAFLWLTFYRRPNSWSLGLNFMNGIMKFSFHFQMVDQRVLC